MYGPSTGMEKTLEATITLIGLDEIRWIKIGSVVLGWLAANSTGPAGKETCQ
jgi:hypothetical protein